MNVRNTISGLAVVGALALTALPHPVNAEQYTVDYGNNYAANFDSETHFKVGETYVITVQQENPPVIVTAPGEAIGGGYTYRPVSIRDQIIDAAARYGLDPVRNLRIADCESKFNPGAVGDSGDAIGLYQFHSALWSSTPQGKAGLSRYDASANIEAAAYVMSHPEIKGMGYGPWTCK